MELADFAIPQEEIVELSAETLTIRPQAGPQEQWLSSPADIAIFGGAAGGGKTWALLLEPLRHHQVNDFGAVIFRRTYPEITNKGGLWDESQKLYPHCGARPRESITEWVFGPYGQQSTVKFAHLQLEKDVLAWRGAQIPMIGFDQIEGFTEHQFWYMLSRNRSMCGIKPYVRGTCNPVTADDPVGGWLNRFIGWWIDQETGYPIEARSGKIRYMVRMGDELIWSSSRADLATMCPELRPMSVTFVPSKLDDNPALLAADPDYKAKLLALPTVERERLLGGNWNIRPAAGKVFNRAHFALVDIAPDGMLPDVRYWDKAGTQDGGCRTAGVKLRRTERGFIVLDVVLGQWGAHQREQVIRQTAELDGVNVTVKLEQEPGSGGKESAEATVRRLTGYDVRVERPTGDKIMRANPFAAQCQAGHVTLLRGPWNKHYLDELHGFPDGAFKDQVDASVGAFTHVAPTSAMEFRCDGRSTQEQIVVPTVPEIIDHRGVYWPRHSMGTR